MVIFIDLFSGCVANLFFLTSFSVSWALSGLRILFLYSEGNIWWIKCLTTYSCLSEKTFRGLFLKDQICTFYSSNWTFLCNLHMMALPSFLHSNLWAYSVMKCHVCHLHLYSKWAAENSLITLVSFFLSELEMQCVNCQLLLIYDYCTTPAFFVILKSCSGPLLLLLQLLLFIVLINGVNYAFQLKLRIFSSFDIFRQCWMK